MGRLERQINFLLELDKLKSVVRQTYLADGSRKEDDAEHSWHLAMMAFVLAEYANEPIDVLKTMKMVMLHDVIEIDAGIPMPMMRRETRRKGRGRWRLQTGSSRCFQQIRRRSFAGSGMSFEAMETIEAKFANTLDKVQPLLLNDASGGKSWAEHGVKASQV